MTNAERILQDFMEWSGGFTPSECTTKQLKTYVELTAPTDIPESEVKEILGL